MLVFLASIALVSVVLPNLYFRVMLYTDNLTSRHPRPRLQMEKIGTSEFLNRPRWINRYQDTSWYAEVKRRKLKELFQDRKWQKQKFVSKYESMKMIQYI